MLNVRTQAGTIFVKFFGGWKNHPNSLSVTFGDKLVSNSSSHGDTGRISVTDGAIAFSTRWHGDDPSPGGLSSPRNRQDMVSRVSALPTINAYKSGVGDIVNRDYLQVFYFGA